MFNYKSFSSLNNKPGNQRKNRLAITKFYEEVGKPNSNRQLTSEFIQNWAREELPNEKHVAKGEELIILPGTLPTLKSATKFTSSLMSMPIDTGMHGASLAGNVRTGIALGSTADGRRLFLTQNSTPEINQVLRLDTEQISFPGSNRKQNFKKVTPLGAADNLVQLMFNDFKMTMDTKCRDALRAHEARVSELRAVDSAPAYMDRVELHLRNTEGKLLEQGQADVSMYTWHLISTKWAQLNREIAAMPGSEGRDAWPYVEGIYNAAKEFIDFVAEDMKDHDRSEFFLADIRLQTPEQWKIFGFSRFKNQLEEIMNADHHAARQVRKARNEDPQHVLGVLAQCCALLTDTTRTNQVSSDWLTFQETIADMGEEEENPAKSWGAIHSKIVDFFNSCHANGLEMAHDPHTMAMHIEENRQPDNLQVQMSELYASHDYYSQLLLGTISKMDTSTSAELMYYGFHYTWQKSHFAPMKVTEMRDGKQLRTIYNPVLQFEQASNKWNATEMAGYASANKMASAAFIATPHKRNPAPGEDRANVPWVVYDHFSYFLQQTKPTFIAPNMSGVNREERQTSTLMPKKAYKQGGDIAGQIPQYYPMSKQQVKVYIAKLRSFTLKRTMQHSLEVITDVKLYGYVDNHFQSRTTEFATLKLAQALNEHVSAEGKSTSTRVQHGERTDVRGYVNKYRATVRASGHEPITEQFDNDTQVQWLFNQVERSLGSAQPLVSSEKLRSGQGDLSRSVSRQSSKQNVVEESKGPVPDIEMQQSAPNATKAAKQPVGRESDAQRKPARSSLVIDGKLVQVGLPAKKKGFVTKNSESAKQDSNESAKGGSKPKSVKSAQKIETTVLEVAELQDNEETLEKVGEPILDEQLEEPEQREQSMEVPDSSRFVFKAGEKRKHRNKQRDEELSKQPELPTKRKRLEQTNEEIQYASDANDQHRGASQ